MWDSITFLIKQYPGFTLAFILIYVALTAVRWIHSAYFEAKKDYLIKLAAYCEDVTDIMGKIAASDYYPREEIEKFWAYYYGKLILVEDQDLETAMVALGNVLEETTQQNYSGRRKQIEGAVLEVSLACRNLIKRSWRLALLPWRDLQAKRQDQEQSAKSSRNQMQGQKPPETGNATFR